MKRGSRVKFSLITTLIAVFFKDIRKELGKTFIVNKVEGNMLYIKVAGIENGFHSLLLKEVK